MCYTAVPKKGGNMNPEMTADVMMVPVVPMWVWLTYATAYVFMAYCMARLAVRVGLDFGSSLVLALIPVANIYLIFKMSGKPWWWTILAFIPIVNLVCFILAWIAYLEKIRKPAWWVILLFIPIVNIIIFLMLAFGHNEPAAA